MGKVGSYQLVACSLQFAGKALPVTMLLRENESQTLSSVAAYCQLITANFLFQGMFLLFNEK